MMLTVWITDHVLVYKYANPCNLLLGECWGFLLLLQIFFQLKPVLVLNQLKIMFRYIYIYIYICN